LKKAFETTLKRLLAAAERRADTVVYASRQRLGMTRDPMLLPYRSHGRDRQLHLRARVVEDLGLTESEHDDSYFQNALGMLRRFKTYDLPHARVRFTCGGASCVAVADEEGHLVTTLAAPELPAGQQWHEVKAELVWSPRHPQGTGAEATLPVLVPGPTARFGVISDVDDTVIETGATSFLKMLRTTLLGNAYTRLPFEGVAAFYQALACGDASCQENPVFYVSSSPWNLYDLLQDFFSIEGLPNGPLFLRNFGIDRDQFIVGGHSSHKREAIDELLETHSHLPFLLIGDSGQEDPEIYAQVARDRPGRVLAIYIRDVTTKKRDHEIRILARQLKGAGIEMVLVKDSLEAAEHAVSRGFIAPHHLAAVRDARSKDLAAGE
jgi:phosphatidate phosphatase APP1